MSQNALEVDNAKHIMNITLPPPLNGEVHPVMQAEAQPVRQPAQRPDLCLLQKSIVPALPLPQVAQPSSSW